MLNCSGGNAQGLQLCLEVKVATILSSRAFTVVQQSHDQIHNHSLATALYVVQSVLLTINAVMMHGYLILDEKGEII